MEYANANANANANNIKFPKYNKAIKVTFVDVENLQDVPCASKYYYYSLVFQLNLMYIIYCPEHKPLRFNIENTNVLTMDCWLSG